MTTLNIISVCGDWHKDLQWALTAIHYARRKHDVDTILHVGDFAYDMKGDFLWELNKKLNSLDMKLYWIEGNHDNHEILNRLPVDENGFNVIGDSFFNPRIFHIPRGHRWEWSGVSFLGLGGAHSVDRPNRVKGLSWWEGEEISYKQASDAIDGGHADILLTHDSPDGADIPGLSETSHYFHPDQIALSDAHRKQLRTIVDAVQPSVLFAGHYHSRYTSQVGPTRVEGLHCNGSSMAENMYVTRIDRIAE